MHQIDMEKFGSFLMTLRKEKGLTQKELGERLFVSDKTVSKWERGQSLPNVSLLIPIAELLEITVTELLKGERIQNNTLTLLEIETLVAGSVQLSAQEQKLLEQNKRKWKILFFICLAVAAVEIAVLHLLFGPTFFENTPVLLGTGLSLLFSCWLCLFSKEVLPTYYDNNQINYIAEGMFRMHIPGLHYNNGNWPHILNASRIYLLGLSIGIPLLYSLAWMIFDLGSISMLTAYINNYMLLPLLLGILVVIYVIGKKYE